MLTTELGAIPSWQPAHFVPYFRKKSSRQNTSLGRKEGRGQSVPSSVEKRPVLDKALLPERLRAGGTTQTFCVPGLVDHL